MVISHGSNKHGKKNLLHNTVGWREKQRKNNNNQPKECQPVLILQNLPQTFLPCAASGSPVVANPDRDSRNGCYWSEDAQVSTWLTSFWAHKLLRASAPKQSYVLMRMCGQEPAAWLIQSLPSEEVNETAILSLAQDTNTGAVTCQEINILPRYNTFLFSLCISLLTSALSNKICKCTDISTATFPILYEAMT